MSDKGRAAGNSPASNVLLGEAVQEVLRQCALAGAPTELFIPGMSQTCKARFETCTTESVVIAILEDSVDDFPVFGLCAVYFVHSNIAHLGLGRILSVRESAEGITVEVEAPALLSIAEPRTSERISVPRGCGLVSFIYHDGELYRATPLNVSLGGMLVDAGRELPGVEVGSVIQLQASWGGASINLPALVRWCEKGCYGLFFNTVATLSGSSTSQELVSIVRQLREMQEERPAA